MVEKMEVIFKVEKINKTYFCLFSFLQSLTMQFLSLYLNENSVISFIYIAVIILTTPKTLSVFYVSQMI